MINNKSVLAIIPARGGSKGVRKKNIRVIAGKPLIAWTIEEAKKSKYIDRVVLSSDDEEIMKVARQWGCEVPFTRPSELAQDQTPGISPVLHALELLGKFDYVILLQPTSPMRKVDSIDGCLDKLESKNGNAIVSVTEPNKNPYWMYKIGDNERLLPFVSQNKLIPQRQMLPEIFSLNGAVYIATYDFLLQEKGFLTSETIGYVMPQEESLDIDTELDLEMCDFLLSKRNEHSIIKND